MINSWFITLTHTDHWSLIIAVVISVWPSGFLRFFVHFHTLMFQITKIKFNIRQREPSKSIMQILNDDFLKETCYQTCQTPSKKPPEAYNCVALGGKNCSKAFSITGSEFLHCWAGDFSFKPSSRNLHVCWAKGHLVFLNIYTLFIY